MVSRRQMLWSALATASGLIGGKVSFSAAPASKMVVRKDPGCMCCDKWAAHLRKDGFTVDVSEDAELEAYKNKLGIPASLRSCHTGVVEGFVVEGHVPVADVQRMLREKPAIAGIAVGGMPMGSPGMEGPVTQPYNTVAFTKDGKTSIFAKH